MKILLNTLIVVIYLVAIMVFASGLLLIFLGGYDFFHVFTYLHSEDVLPVGLMATGLLEAVDLFLIGIVLFIFSLGLLILFSRKSTPVPVDLPDWLRVKDFMHLKIILWEAILTTMVVSYLAALAELRFKGIELTITVLIVPGAILLMAFSLYLLKKREK